MWLVSLTPSLFLLSGLAHFDGSSGGDSLGLETVEGRGKGVSNLGGGGLRFTDHDCQQNWDRSTLEEDFLLGHKAKLCVVGIVGQGTRLKVDRPVLSISLEGDVLANSLFVNTKGGW